MRWIPPLLALAFALPLHAGDFQKCRGEGGATAYRADGCLAGETLVAVLEPVADPPQAQRPVAMASEPSHSRTPTSKRSKASRSHTGKSRGKRSRGSRKNPCRSAKQARDDFRRRRGLKITMDELSRWSHRVYDACK